MSGDIFALSYHAVEKVNMSRRLNENDRVRRSFRDHASACKINKKLLMSLIDQ